MVIAVEDYSNDKTGIIGENKESTQVVGDVETGIEGQEEGELGLGVPAGVEAVYRWRLQQEHRMRDSDKPSLTDEQVVWCSLCVFERGGRGEDVVIVC